MKMLILFFALALVSRAADDTPAWLRSAAADKLAAFDAKTPAVVLLNESSVYVEESGRIVTTDRYAIKILNRAGLPFARATKVYMRDTGKVRDMKAWIIPASGTPRRLEKDKYFDVGVGDDALYEDIRARVVNAERDVDPGAVFGYESVVEEKAVFTQVGWEFGERLPTRLARFSLTLPSGWSAKAVTLNHPDITAAESGATRTWEVRDLPWYEGEPGSPGTDSIRPRIAISFFPGANTGSNVGPSFAKWQDVSSWLSGLHDPQATADEAITSKVRELTAKLTTPEDKIRALAGYVQTIRYVSIQTGLGRGGGYKPHTAATIFAKSYGDCKDKATLLRAMLKAAGIESWPVVIFSGDPLYVKDAWPSPQQFNHCIIAIAVPAGFKGDAVLDNSKLGRLLFFDPTDAFTPVGELPVHEQQSLALLIAGGDGDIHRMPAGAPDANLTSRRIEAAIAADGSIIGNMREEMRGWTAVLQRASLRERGDQVFRKRLETRVTERLRTAAITELKTSDTLADSHFQIDLKFTSGNYAQTMQGRLMVFQPAILQPFDPLPFTETKRLYPAIVNARSWRDSVSVKLPAGFEVDEIPDAARTTSPFGSYEAVSTVKDGVLTYTRVLTLNYSVVPPEDYARLKEFSDRVSSGDQAPIVLVRK